MSEISYLHTILEGLRVEMEQSMVPNDFYQFSPKIVRGIVTWEESNNNRPLIWFVSTGISYEETMSNITKAEISVEFHGYTDVDNYGSSNDMLTLLRDLEYFLYNDYTETIMLGNCVIDEGGINADVSQSGFLLNAKVFTDFNITNIK